MNDAPVLAAPGSLVTLEDTGLALTGLVISDVDVATGSMRLTLSVPAGEGVINWTATPFISASGSGTSTLVLQGQRTALNNAIAAGAVVYMPVAQFSGVTNLTVTINDKGNNGIDPGLTGDASSEEATRIIPVSVMAVNDAPAGADATLTTSEDTAYVFASTNFGFTDPDDTPANALQSVIITTLPALGTLRLSGVAVTAGQNIGVSDIPNLTWTPPANANGVAYTSFTFQVVDDGGTANGGLNTDASPNIITFNVTPVNDAPASPPLSAIASQDADVISVDLGASFSDVDGDALTYTVTGLPPGLSYNASTGIVSGTLPSNASQGGVGGTYAISVTADDGQGGQTVRTFTWTVINPPPIAQDDLISGLQNSMVTGSVFANHGAGSDSDPDGDAFSVVSVNGSSGNVGVSISGSNGGQFVVQANGGFSFNPGTDFIDVAVGATRDTQLTYQISDGQGGFDTAVVTVRVAGVNDAPVSSSIGNRINLDSDVISLNAAPAFSDPDHDALTFSATGLPPGLSIDANTGLITGTINASASQGGVGGVYSVTVTATDPHGAAASQTFSWSVSNPLPTANNDSVTLLEDSSATITVLANDVDPDLDPLTVTAATAAHGAVVINGDGTLTYTPDSNYNGPDTIIYSISDGNGGTSTAAVDVTVTPGNDGPSVVAIPTINSTDSGVINFDASAYFDDIDMHDPNVPVAARDALTFSATGLPPGLSIDPVTGVISGTLPPNASDLTPYSVTITVTDKGGLTTSTTFDWHVENVAPMAGPDYVTIAEDSGPVTVLVTFNDHDPDFDAFALIDTPGSFGAAHGTVSVNTATGEVTYTPDANFNGIDTVTYTIRDADGALGVGTLTVTVNPVNDAPTMTAMPPASSLDGQAVSINTSVYFNDIDRSDAPADMLTFSATGLPPGLSINAVTGVISGTIDHTASGPTGAQIYAVAVTATDSAGAFVTNILNWTVTNPAPTANNNSVVTAEDTPAIINVLGNDSDPDGDTLTVDQATASHGTVVINGDGTLTYTPDANFNGSDTILYRITDGNGGFATASVSVTVTAVNDTPTSTPIPLQISDDSATVSFAVQPFFNDVDTLDATPDHLSYSASGLPRGLSINAATGLISGTIAHDASMDFGGVHTVTVTVTDDFGATTSRTFTWRVFNPDPVPQNDAAAGNEDSVISGNVAANDSDPDGDPLTFGLVGGGPAHGAIVFNSDGSFTYTPDANFHGTDSFSYWVDDSNGGFVTAIVTISVASVNDAPVAVADVVTTPEDTAVTITPLGNDSDVDGDPLTVTSASAASGSVTINPDGTLLYTPVANFHGTDTITYIISDGNGGFSTATVSVVVTPVNDAPVAADNVSATIEDIPVTISVLGNDTDIDGDSLTVTAASAGHGTVTINPDGTLLYQPAPNFNGIDTITYTISDGNGGSSTATVTVTVAPVNDAPVAVADSVTTPEETALTIPVLGNDSDVDGDTLAVTSASAGSGTVTINPDGTLHYSPAPNFTGTDIITYIISDGQGGTATATVTVTVTPVNDPPVAVDDVVWTQEDTPVNLAVLQNDSDNDGDALSVTAASALHGTVAINPDGTITYVPDANFHGADTIVYTISDGQGGVSTAQVAVTVAPVNDAPVANADTMMTGEDTPVTFAVLGNDTDIDGNPLTVTYAVASGGVVTVNGDGTLTYTPPADFNGIDVITYTISDGQGGSSTATVTVNVTAGNDPPVAANDTALTAEDMPVVISVLGNDSDLDGDTLAVTSATALNGTVVIAPDGTIEYSPNANFHGTDTISYMVSDGHGGFSTATVSVTVTPVNDGPVANADSVSTTEDMPVTIVVLGNDNDIDGDTLSVIGASAGNGIVAVNPDGTITYTPNANFNGTDIITYTISDGNGGTSTATVSVNVAAANDIPVAGDDAATTAEDTPVTLAVLGNDTDADGDTLTLTNASAGHGAVTINPDGTITYVPDPAFNGVDTIVYTVSDGRCGLTTASVIVTVSPVNDAPAATDDVAATDEDTPVTIHVLGNDVDMDGDALSVISANASNGAVTINADGSITYRPNANFNGTNTIHYFISDGNGGTAHATATVTVSPVNDAPVAGADVIAVTEDMPVTGNVLANDADPDGGTVRVTGFAIGGIPYVPGATVNLPEGTFQLAVNGHYSFTPAPDFNGPVPVITYTIGDGQGEFATATLTLGPVTPVNDAPDAAGPMLATKSTDPVSGAILASDRDGDALTFSLQTAPAKGTVTLNADGSFVFMPARGSEGPDSFTIFVSDGFGGVTPVTVHVLIERVDEAPIAPPAPNDPAIPATPTAPAPMTPIGVDGVVLDTVSGFGGLRSVANSISAERPVVAAVNEVQSLGGTAYLDPQAGRGQVVATMVQRLEQGSQFALLAASAPGGQPFEARSFLGHSSGIALKTIDMAGRLDEVRIETIRHRSMLYLQLVEQSAPRGDRDVIDYRIRMADGSPVPEWLRRIGPETYAGTPDANTGVIDMVISVVRRDGLVTEHAVRLDPATGQLSPVPGQADETLPLGLTRAPLFTEQMQAMAAPAEPDIESLERALGLR